MSEVVGALELVRLEKFWDGQKRRCAERVACCQVSFRDALDLFVKSADLGTNALHGETGFSELLAEVSRNLVGGVLTLSNFINTINRGKVSQTPNCSDVSLPFV